MKLMLVGYANRGKTTLIARLQGKEYGDESTVGVDVSEWWYHPLVGRRAFHFSIWDFGGQEEYYATHQIFLSKNSLYLLLFNLKHGDKGMEELRPWLNNIALCAPHSCVIIVGTHLDEVSDEERGEIDALLYRVGELAASYNEKLQIVEVLPVGLKNRIENIGLLKEAIYNHAANFKDQDGQLIMGRKVPASYHALEQQLETVQQEVRQGIREPIMHAEEFRTMVYQMNLADIQDEEELKKVTSFLTSVGSLLHYDDPGSNLHELYFVDPRWLCDMMSKVVTIKERNPFVKHGILYSKDIPVLFRDKQFPWQYFEQYLTLLNRFEIALPLDNQRVLIPSMLMDERPKEFQDESYEELVYSRFVLFDSANTPPGFWSRILSRIMHSIPKVCYALDKSMPTSEHSSSPIATNNDNADVAEMSFSMHPMTPTEADRVFDNINASTKASLSMSTALSSGAQTPAGTPGSAIPFIAAPTISGPLPFISAQQPFLNVPQLLPNFPKSLPKDSFDSKDIHLEYWRTGLYYKDPEIMFRIESLTGNKRFKRGSSDGVAITAFLNDTGRKIICQLIDLVITLIREWYSGLKKGMKQAVPCLECIKQGRPMPFEFHIQQCLPAIAKNEKFMECQYFKEDTAKNHTVLLADIVPDLLLQDIDPRFILEAKEIIFREEDTSLLGEGGYGKVYQGKCKTKVVAIKKYTRRSEETLVRLRSEAKFLLQLHYPCLVSLIGICVHPLMVLVLELAPLKSLDFPILGKKIPVHRLTIFRIATEVAAALHFLHNRGIIFRDLKASNILLWTLDPDSLCHCKLADFSIATKVTISGNRGLLGTKGFTAPEVLHIGKRKQRSVYDHRADIFSFGMFLYQIIARRNPYHNIPPHRIDAAVEFGERPKLQDVDVARTGYYYLTKVMMACWEDNPKKRLSTDTIIKKVSLSSTQMVMGVIPIMINKFSLRRAVAITPTNFANVGLFSRHEGELWVCCDGNEGAKISMFNLHSMVEVSRVFIKDNQVQYMALCGNHVWVASRAGINYGEISIFSIGSRELIHNVPLHENSVTCITATDTVVYLGTLEGYCLSFYNDMDEVRAKTKPKYISEYAVDGIVCTQHCVWISHTRYIYFLNFDNLALEGSIHRDKECEAYIGQLSYDPDLNIVWSAHLGGTILSAWNAPSKCHIYDVDIGEHLKRIACTIVDSDLIITAIVLALDTVWVGMASGHIMVFHEQELLCWFHPYEKYVRFLTCIPSAGPCGMEKAIIVSGGKGFIPLVEDFEGKTSEEQISDSQGGTMIIWEAYEAKTIKQVKLIEKSSPNHFQDHNSLCGLIQQGDFRDGTLIMSNPAVTNDPVSTNIASPHGNANFSTATSGYGTQTTTLTQEYEEMDNKEKDTDSTVTTKVHVVYTSTQQEILNIKLPNSEQSALVNRSNDSPRSDLYGTHIKSTPSNDFAGLEPSASYDRFAYAPDRDALPPELSWPFRESFSMNPTRTDSLGNTSTNFFMEGGRITAGTSRSPTITEKECGEEEAKSSIPTTIPKLHVHIQSVCPQATTTVEETFNVWLPDTQQEILVRCGKPVKLKVLLSEVRVTIARGDCRLEYYRDGRPCKLQTQEQLDEYLRLPKRPQLSLMVSKSKGTHH